MERGARTADSIELLLASIEATGGTITTLVLHPNSCEILFRNPVDQVEIHRHPERLTLVEGDQICDLLTPIVRRRWNLAYIDDPQRFDMWTWRAE